MPGTAVGPVKSSLGGATSAMLNITAAQVIKASPGVAVAIVCLVTGGTVTLNDCTTTGAAAATNAFFTGTLTVGQVVPLNWPCATGLVISAVSAGTFAVSYL